MQNANTMQTPVWMCGRASRTLFIRTGYNGLALSSFLFVGCFCFLFFLKTSSLTAQTGIEHTG